MCGMQQIGHKTGFTSRNADELNRRGCFPVYCVLEFLRVWKAALKVCSLLTIPDRKNAGPEGNLFFSFIAPRDLRLSRG